MFIELLLDKIWRLVRVDRIFSYGIVGHKSWQVFKQLCVRHGIVPKDHPGLVLTYVTLVMDLIKDVEADQLWVQVDIITEIQMMEYQLGYLLMYNVKHFHS